MGTQPIIEFQRDIDRYEAVMRISEAIAECREPEELARTLADEIGKSLPFDHLYFAVLKPNSSEIEYLVWGKGPMPLPNLPMEELPMWEAVRTGVVQHTNDWDTEERFLRFKHWAREIGLGSGVRVPLATQHRLLGVFEINRDTVNPFTEEQISFLHLIGRVVAFTLDAGLNLKCAQQENERLELLLNLTSEVTSSLDLRAVLHAVAANIREVIHADAVIVALLDAAQEKFRVLAMDFPHGKGIIKEELLVAPSASARKAMDTLKPVVLDMRERGAAAEVSALSHSEGIKAVCNIPLLNRGRVLGVLSILRTKEIPFNPEAVDFLKRASGQIAIAVENAAAFQEISELVEERKRAQQALAVQNTRLQLLLELSRRITSNLEIREVLRSVSVATREIMHADAAGIAFFDKASDKARIYAVDFPTAKGFVKEEIVVTPGLAFKRAWESSQPAVINTNDLEELGPEIYELVIAEGLNGHCLIPLVSRGRTVGVLIVASKLRDAVTPEDVDFLSRASGQVAIAIENALAYREISELKDKLAQEKFYLEEEIRSEMNFENIIGNSSALKHVLELVETVAPSDSTVLLLGETGTGKELIARAIHDRSRRKDRTFVKLNCAAIPTGLLESELFGHEKGAFTGAISQKIGRMELADQGTLFLDEVGDIPFEIQPKLLRALQEREFERLGSTHTRRVNIRLIAATNRDLEKMIADREFRSDLYYRLHVFPIRIPPLRERKDDIPQLVSYFVQKFAKPMQKRIEVISPTVMKGLTAWDWPGNIRELENFIERAVILTRGKSLEAPLGELRRTNTVELTPVDPQHQVAGDRETSQSNRNNVADDYERRQRDEIIRALTACKGRVGGANGAAARLGMNRTTFLSRMKKFGIYAKQYA